MSKTGSNDNSGKSSQQKQTGLVGSLAKKAANAGAGLLVKLGKNPREVTHTGQTAGSKSDGKKPVTVKGSADKPDGMAAFRGRVPGLTQQLLGRRFGKVSRVAGMVIPNGALDQIMDAVFAKAADLAADLAKPDQMLQGAGVASLAALRSGDSDRQEQLATQATEQNRILAMTEGGVTGGLGFAGKLVDLPSVLILVLRTIYQVGHSYGFELKGEAGRRLVFEVLSEVDFDALTQKEAIALGINSLAGLLGRGDTHALSLLISGGNPLLARVVDKGLSMASDRLNLHQASYRIEALARLAGVINGAVHNTMIIDQVAQTARSYFQQARRDGKGSAMLLAQMAQEQPEVTTPSASGTSGYGYDTAAGYGYDTAAGYGYDTSAGYGYDVGGTLRSALDTVKSAAASVADKIASAGSAVSSQLQPEKAHQLVDQVADQFDQVTTRLGEQVSDLAEQVRNTLDTDALAEKAHELVDRAKAGADVAVERAANQTEKAGSVLQDMDSTAAGVRAHDAIDQTAERVEQAKDTVTDKVGDLADKASALSDKAGEVTQAMQNKSAGDAQSAATDKADGVSQNAKQAADMMGKDELGGTGAGEKLKTAPGTEGMSDSISLNPVASAKPELATQSDSKPAAGGDADTAVSVDPVAATRSGIPSLPGVQSDDADSKPIMPVSQVGLSSTSGPQPVQSDSTTVANSPTPNSQVGVPSASGPQAGGIAGQAGQDDDDSSDSSDKSGKPPRYARHRGNNQ